MAEIWRKRSFGLGFETTAGTAVSATAWFPVENATLDHSLEKIKDGNSKGIIDEITDSYIAKEMSELSMEGIARSQTIGNLLKMALGTVGSATLVETAVYTHAFSRANTNAHPTATVYCDNSLEDERAPFHVLDTLDIDIKSGEYVKFNAKTKGGKIESTTSSPSFLTGTSDEMFRASKATIKIATDIAGLSGASAITLEGVKFTIKKNPVMRFALGATTPSVNANQQFNVVGDLTVTYNANTYRDLFTANTKKALQIEIEGSTLIGATKYNKITIQFAQVHLESWKRSSGNNDLLTETFGFEAEYSVGDTQTMNVVLQNNKSSNY